MLTPRADRWQIAAELAEADRTHSVIPRITARYPEATRRGLVRDPGRVARPHLAAGRRLVGRKIGLTSKAMQQATGIREPDYGVMFDDTVYASGAEIPVDDVLERAHRGRAGASSCSTPLEGPTARSTTPSRRSTTPCPRSRCSIRTSSSEGRTIVDTIADNAAYGAMVLGDVHKRPDEIDLRWVPGVLARNGEIEETGVAAGVLGHPATGVAWLANKFHQHGAQAGGGRDHPRRIVHAPACGCRGATACSCDYGPMGVIECRFV